MDTGSKPTTDNHAVKKAESINSHYIVISDLARNVKRFYYFFFLFSPPFGGNAVKLSEICDDSVLQKSSEGSKGTEGSKGP